MPTRHCLAMVGICPKAFLILWLLIFHFNELMAFGEDNHDDDGDDEVEVHLEGSRIERTPVYGGGYFKLTEDYNMKVPPKNMRKIGILMEPMLTLEVDSLTRRLRMKMKKKLVWNDDRIETARNKTFPSGGGALNFDTQLLK